MSQDLEIKAQPQRIEVIDPIPLLDTGRFEQIQRIASIMARSSLTPDHLRTVTTVDDDGNTVYENGRRQIEHLSYEAIFANCFRVVNQAMRWGTDPFATAECTSVVRGKLCYEGKLVAGVLDAKLGIELAYEWNDLKGDAYGITVSGRTQKRGELKSIKGTVGEWKTNRKGSPWLAAGNHTRMLVYRGAREWARIYKPSLMLGVYTDDEIEALETRRSIAPVQHALGKSPDAHYAGITREVSSLHGSPELDADAAKLEAMGQDAGPTLQDLQAMTNVSEKLKAMAEEAGPVDANPTEASSSAPTLERESTPSTSATPEGSPSGEVSTTESLPEQSTESTSSPRTTTAPEGSTAPPQPTESPAMPDNPTKAEDYEAFWIKCLAVCEDRQDAAAEWASQRKLRNKLVVDMAVVERCKAMVDEQFPKEG